MPTYQRKSTHTIEATQFTPALGDILRMFAAGTIPELPADVPALLVWSEQGGYRLDGAPISFGDYIVGGAVMSREEFEQKWEPVIERPTVAEVRAHMEAVSGVNSVARGAAEPVAPAPRSRRTRSEDAQ
jgi:hypothetical protein